MSTNGNLMRIWQLKVHQQQYQTISNRHRRERETEREMNLRNAHTPCCTTPGLQRHLWPKVHYTILTATIRWLKQQQQQQLVKPANFGRKICKFSCNFTRTQFAYLLNFVIEFDKLEYAMK